MANETMAKLLMGYAPTQGMTPLSKVDVMKPNNPTAATITGIKGIVTALAEKKLDADRTKAIGEAITGAKASGGSLVDALLKSDNDRAKELGTQLQIIEALREPSESPSSVREYEYFNALPPEEQNRYLTMKRSSQIMNLGGTQAIYDPLTQGKGSEFAVTPKPEQMPEFQGEQARAKKAAEIGATAEGDIAKKGRQAEGMLDLVAMAEEVLPKATSGTLEKIGTSVAGAAGVSTERSRADKQLKVISAGLVANVPRMEGPQSNYDVQLYREAAGDIANPDLPDKDRMAALQTVKALQQKYAGASMPQTGDSAGGGSPSGIKFLGFE